MRRTRWRVMLVVTRDPPRGGHLPSAEPQGLPPVDVAAHAAVLLAWGAEVRVLDQDVERLSDRLVRREAHLWRPDLVLLWAGGGLAADDPVPDDEPLAGVLAGWSWEAPLLAAGPLARRFGRDLLQRNPRLQGVLVGPPGPGLVGAFSPAAAPGVGRLVDGQLAVVPPGDATDVLPAWHALPLESYPGRGPGGLRCASVRRHGPDAEAVLGEVRHAVHRAGARFLVFEGRDLGSEREVAVDVARHMFGAAPGIGWSCRVRADHVDPAFVLALARGGCEEVLVASPLPPDAPAAAPMDSPARPRIESAVEAVRVTGMAAVVEHVLGRPGDTRNNLSAWQRWFRDRQIAVRPRTRVAPAGRAVTLEEAARGAGCFDNELTRADLERAARMLGAAPPSRLAGWR